MIKNDRRNVFPFSLINALSSLSLSLSLSLSECGIIVYATFLLFLEIPKQLYCIHLEVFVWLCGTGSFTFWERDTDRESEKHWEKQKKKIRISEILFIKPTVAKCNAIEMLLMPAWYPATDWIQINKWNYNNDKKK